MKALPRAVWLGDGYKRYNVLAFADGGLGTIYESLSFYNKPQVSEPVPLLGTEYSWNEAGTELAVTLREGVTWSDGEAFTADDVVFTFEMLLSEPSINNGGINGRVEAVDDTHVVFTFEAPAFVQGAQTLGQTAIVPEHLWRDVNPVEDVIENPIGTGAYKLKNFTPQAFTVDPSQLNSLAFQNTSNEISPTDIPPA